MRRIIFDAPNIERERFRFQASWTFDPKYWHNILRIRAEIEPTNQSWYKYKGYMPCEIHKRAGLNINIACLGGWIMIDITPFIYNRKKL